MKSPIHPFGILLLFLCLCLFTKTAIGQIHVAPLAVYVSDERPAGRIEILNSGHLPAEVTVDIGYGYPQSDDEGQMYMKWLDPIPPSEPSAVDWVQIYPYRFTLEPGVRQTVRFAVFAPDSTPAGEYWARPIVATRFLKPHSSRPAADVTARLRVIRRTVLALNYRHRRDRLHTTPVIDSVKVRREEDRLIVRPFIRQRGNAAVLGTFRLVLRDSLGRPASSGFERRLAVYHRLSRRIILPVAGLKEGTYQLSMEVTSDRSQTSPEHILPFEPVFRTRRVEL